MNNKKTTKTEAQLIRDQRAWRLGELACSGQFPAAEKHWPDEQAVSKTLERDDAGEATGPWEQTKQPKTWRLSPGPDWMQMKYAPPDGAAKSTGTLTSAKAPVALPQAVEAHGPARIAAAQTR